MSFTIDKQTLEDLNLLGKYRSDSIFHIYDHTVTRGGQQLLEEMFLHPFSDARQIEARNSLFSFFMNHAFNWPFQEKALTAAEYCLSSPVYGSRLANAAWLARRKSMLYIASDRMCETLSDGVIGLMEVLDTLRSFCRECSRQATSPVSLFQEVEAIWKQTSFKSLFEGVEGKSHLCFKSLERMYYQLRVRCGEQVERLMHIVYELDIYIHTSKMAVDRGFCIAALKPGNRMNIEGLFHPAVRGAKSNDIGFDDVHNVVFLTGANMAGKSTFMKAFGIAVYLAHMGFPVPASSMEFSVRDGLFTSINVSDNLDKGYSHYYAEVLRVKSVAEEVAACKKLVVIFDELFKGTNVKDAYDATKAVIKAFSEHHSCLFLVSTHIIEVCNDMQAECDNFIYVYFPTMLVNGIPRYTYKLALGITSDRHGMMIIRNEHILELVFG